MLSLCITNAEKRLLCKFQTEAIFFKVIVLVRNILAWHIWLNCLCLGNVFHKIIHISLYMNRLDNCIFQMSQLRKYKIGRLNVMSRCKTYIDPNVLNFLGFPQTFSQQTNVKLSFLVDNRDQVIAWCTITYCPKKLNHYIGFLNSKILAKNSVFI